MNYISKEIKINIKNKWAQLPTTWMEPYKNNVELKIFISQNVPLFVKPEGEKI